MFPSQQHKSFLLIIYMPEKAQKQTSNRKEATEETQFQTFDLVACFTLSGTPISPFAGYKDHFIEILQPLESQTTYR